MLPRRERGVDGERGRVDYVDVVCTRVLPLLSPARVGDPRLNCRTRFARPFPWIRNNLLNETIFQMINAEQLLLKLMKTIFQVINAEQLLL